MSLEILILFWSTVTVMMMRSDLKSRRSQVKSRRRSGYRLNVYLSRVLFSLSHRSSHSTNVDFAAFTGNHVNHTVLSGWIDNVLWSY